MLDLAAAGHVTLLQSPPSRDAFAVIYQVQYENLFSDFSNLLVTLENLYKIILM